MNTPETESQTEQKACPIDTGTLQDQLRQHRMLLDLGRAIVSEMDMDALFDLIMNRTRQFMGTERCSVFLFDPKKNQLWSRVSTDLRNNEVRFSADQGIAGWVFQNREPLQVDDAYTDPRFYREVDRLTNFKTKNILCLPLINRHGDCIGTLQIINKLSGSFNENDIELLTSVCHYIAIALENAQLYDDLKVLDKAKERVINHLSHELKTPLSILGAALELLARQLNEAENPKVQKTLNRGRRQLTRLLDLQGKINDILNQQPVQEQRQILNIIENAANLVAEFREENSSDRAEILGFIAERLDSLFMLEETHPERIHIASFLQETLQEARSTMDSREIEFRKVLDESLEIWIGRSILRKVMSGLLKNAIENTPDEGIIELYGEKRKELFIWK
jgi:GAF domain-containing protein